MNFEKPIEEDYSKFIEQLNAMSHSLEQRLPEFPGQLTRLNVLLLQRPELGNILSEEEIGALMKGVIANAGVQFTIGGKAGSSKAKFKAEDLDQLEL